MDHEALKTVTAILKFLMCLGIFYWMRIFNGVAYYITMIIETVKDILGFSILFLLLLGAFSSSILILNDYDTNADLPNTLVAKSFGNEFVDVLLQQYLLGLGEFNQD